MKKLLAILLMGILTTSVFSFSAYAEDSLEPDNSIVFYDVEGTYPDGETSFVYFDDLLLEGTSSTMSGDLAKVSVALASAAYTIDGTNSCSLAQMMTGMDFKSYQSYGYEETSLDDNDRVAFAVGSKTVGSKTSGGKIIYCIPIRGTYSYEWFSDFYLGNPTDYEGHHAGFYIAANRVMATLNDIFINDKYDKSNRVLWFMGHSRGAAVANILEAFYSDSPFADAENVYGYNFACPNVSLGARGSDDPQTADYTNIFNFNNSGDAVPCMPLKAWGYNRHGVTYSYGTGKYNRCFQTRFYQEFGRENTSAVDTVDYEMLMMTAMPGLDEALTPEARLAMQLIAWGISGKGKEVTLQQLVTKVASDLCGELDFTEINSIKDLYDAYNEIYHASKSENFINAKDYELFLKNAEEATRFYSQTEFQQWLSENSEILVEIFEITGKVISEYSDLVPAADVITTIIKYAPGAWKTGTFIGIALDFTNNNGSVFNIPQALWDGHMTGTYVEVINTAYFGRYAKKDMTSVGIVSLPRNVKTIGYGCFQNSDISVFDADNILYISDCAFKGCSNLVSTNLGSIPKLKAHTFHDCSSLEEIFIPDSVSDIEVDAKEVDDRGPFYGCTGLKEISVGGVKELESGMLRTGSQVLEKLTIRGTVQTIGAGALDSTYDYSEYYRVTTGPNIFGYYYDRSNGYDCAEASAALIIEEGVETIENNAFLNCKIFTSVSVPSSLNEIGDYAFSECSRLTGLELKNVGTIGNNAFSYCAGIQQLDLGNAAIIGSYAFQNCISLENLYIPDSVTTIEVDTEGHTADNGSSWEYYYRGPFYGCTGLKEISVGGVETLMPGMLMTGSQVLENLTIRGTVQTIGAGALDSTYDYSEYRRVTTGPNIFGYYYDRSNGYDCAEASAALIIEDGVEIIENNAFLNCKVFRSAVIPATITEIGINAFDGSHPNFIFGYNGSTAQTYASTKGMRFVSLDEPVPELILPASVQTIGEEAFADDSFGCIALSENVFAIDVRAFADNTALYAVIIPKATVEIDATAFDGCTDVSLRAPEGGTVQSYAYEHMIPFVPIG